MDIQKDIEQFSGIYQRVMQEIGRDIIGQQETVEHVVIAMIAGGNVLLEGVPGTGKTRLVRTIGRVFGLPFSRIQFLPDLMPSDVTGTNVLEKDEEGRNHFRFQPGPIFSSIVLADEINRATPKTQSALLEAMQEHMVSVGSKDYPLDDPFFVLATQNPIEQEGTYALPEAQIDRFMFKLILPFPAIEELMDIVTLTQDVKNETAQQVLDGQTLLRMQACARQILVQQELLRYAMTLVSATHASSAQATETAKAYIRMGASPRAGQALISAAKVRALVHGRYNVSKEDIDALAFPVLRHRIKLSYDATALRKTPDELIAAIIDEVRQASRKPLFHKKG